MSTQKNSNITDIWQEKLDKALKTLQECQKNNNIDDCLQCDKLIGCDTRNSYVRSVYESMNKGEGGGFEF